MKTLYRILCLCTLAFSFFNASAQVPIHNSYPSAPAVIFLDFDGQTVNGTSWNINGPVFCNASGLSSTQVTEIFHRVAEDYRPFNVNVTTDSTKYWSAPSTKRMRVILTPSWEWNINKSGGVAYVNSFSWGDNTPAFVFTSLLNNNTKNIAEAASHEAGHTLGLRHQSAYDGSCTKTSEYNSGSGTGEIGWAPIMGVGYSRNLTLWNNGANPFGCANFQDDLSIITGTTNGIGYRPDDHASTTTGASVATFTSNKFTIGGIIERGSDVDMIKFNLPVNGKVQVDAVPFSVGSGNSGSNIDIQIELLNNAGAVIETFNPGDVLCVKFERLLTSGTYFLRIRGMGNVNAPGYASLGSYTVNSTFIAASALPLHKLELNGITDKGKNKFTWEIEADETLIEQTLEVSTDGRTFNPVTKLNTAARTFDHLAASGILYYRLHVAFNNGRKYYSNIVSLTNVVTGKPTMMGNISRGSLSINSTSQFQYVVFDMNGRTVSKGNLIPGLNTINTSFFTSGMYVMQYFNQNEQYTDKFMKQ